MNFSSSFPLVLLFAAFIPAHAANIAALLGGSPPSSTCATTDTAIPHDVLLEGFQDADGYELTWAEFGTTANITEGADSTALTVNKPVGACDKAWRIVVPTDGTETGIQFDLGSPGAAIDVDTQPIDIVFYLWIETAPTANAFRIFTASGSNLPTGAYCAGVGMQVTSGSVYLTGLGATASATTLVVAGQWYKVALHIDTATAGNTSTITVNDGTPQGFNRNTANDPRYFYVGAPNAVDVGDSGTLWFDLVCINTP